MRATVWPLLLVLAPNLCAQAEPSTRPFVPIVAVDPSYSPKPGEIVSTRELLIPPKAIREIQRSQSAFLSGDVRSSAKHLERALQIYPHYLEAHNNLGSRYIELREYEKAAAEFQKAIDLDPRVTQPFNNLSVALFLLQRYPDAEIAARHALDLDSHNSTAQYMLGCVLATEKHNPSEAIEMLRQTEGEFPDARLLLAQVLLRQGSVNEAKSELRDYLKVPGVEKRQKVECWLARLEQTSATTGCGQASTR
jgi:tetratricopeptide (TPR) repeat protein